MAFSFSGLSQMSHSVSPFCFELRKGIQRLLVHPTFGSVHPRVVRASSTHARTSLPPASMASTEGSEAVSSEQNSRI